MSKLFINLFYMIGVILNLSISLNVQAKPELKPLDSNIAEIGSQYYNFKIKEFTSIDKQRTYRVWLGIPKIDVSLNKKMYSVFMLDGNSVMSYLNDDLLKELHSSSHAPVLIAIGYKTNLPFEIASRSLDYTPADLTSNKPAPDPRNPSRMSGGSSDFGNIIVNDIAPWVEKNVNLDPNNRAIWGHSYGGLFVLDSILSNNYFSHYFAASPSLSWADQRMMQKIQSAKVSLAKHKHLLLMEGDISGELDNQQSSNYDTDNIDKNRKILYMFHQQGVDARFLIYPNLKHGEVFKASLLDVLYNKFY